MHSMTHHIPYLPNNEAIERGLLRIVIDESAHYPAILSAGITEKTFYYPAFKLTWKAIQNIGCETHYAAINEKSIAEEIHKIDAIVDNDAIIKYIMDGDVEVGMTDHFIAVLKDKERRRELMENMMRQDVFKLSDLLANSSVYVNSKYINDAVLETYWRGIPNKPCCATGYVVRLEFPEDRQAAAAELLDAICYAMDRSAEEERNIEIRTRRINTAKDKEGGSQ